MKHTLKIEIKYIYFLLFSIFLSILLSSIIFKYLGKKKKSCDQELKINYIFYNDANKKDFRSNSNFLFYSIRLKMKNYFKDNFEKSEVNFSNFTITSNNLNCDKLYQKIINNKAEIQAIIYAEVKNISATKDKYNKNRPWDYLDLSILNFIDNDYDLFEFEVKKKFEENTIHLHLIIFLILLLLIQGVWLLVRQFRIKFY